MVAGLIVGSLIDRQVLAQFYADPEHAVPLITIYTGIIGVMVGAIVVAVFNKSERVRRSVAERAALQ